MDIDEKFGIAKEIIGIRIEQARFEKEVDAMKNNLTDSLRSGISVEIRQNMNEPLLFTKKHKNWKEKLRDFRNRIKTVFGWT